MFACLLDKFHLSVAEYAELTDRQIHQLYFHKRTKEGAIDVPDHAEASDGVPLTYEQEVQKLMEAKAKVGLSDENVRACVAGLKKKFGRK
jgi:hypothetical protein